MNESRLALPRTFPELISEEGKRGIARAETLLNAIQNLQVVVVLNGERQPAQTIKIAGASAIIEVVVNIS
jgi:hypothetical protein